MATSMMKQRLIGAAVLIALGVIFIPMLLTGDGNFLSGDMESNVPDKPMYELQAPKVLSLDKQPATQTSEPVGEPAPASAKPETDKAQTDKAEKVAAASAAAQSATESIEADAVVPEAEKVTDSKQADTQKKPDQKSASIEKAEAVTQPKAEAKTEAKTSTQPTTTPSAEKQQPAATAAKTIQKRPIVSGWVVQLGSFSVQKNALNLRDKLRKKGHASFVEEFERNGKISYRVRVGPELTRELAVALKKKLKAETKIDGFVIEFPGK